MIHSLSPKQTARSQHEPIPRLEAFRMPYESTHPSSPSYLAGLSPDAIERRLGDLIRHYVQGRSPTIARSVVGCIEALCAHPGFEGDWADRCAYLRLRTHWRWLAEAASRQQVAG